MPQRPSSTSTEKRRATHKQKSSSTRTRRTYVRKHATRSSFVDPSSPAARKAKLATETTDAAERTQDGVGYVIQTKTGKKRIWIRPPGFGRKADGSGPGVTKGSISSRTKEMKEMIQLRGPELVQRLFQLAFGYDLPTAHNACKTLMAYGYGRPTVHVELERGSEARSYVAEMPPPITHEQWMANMQKTYGPQVIDVTAKVSTTPAAETPTPTATPTAIATPDQHTVNGNGRP